jgi:hypothetical protein
MCFISVLAVSAGLLAGLLLMSATALAAESWLNKSSGGFGDYKNTRALSMAVYKSQLYVGTSNFDEGCEVWRFDGSAWTQVVGQDPPGTPGTGPGFGDMYNEMARTMEFMGSYLYVGTSNNYNGCEVWRYDGAHWAQVVGQGTSPDPTAPGFGDFGNCSASSMTVFDGNLYVGTERGLITSPPHDLAGSRPSQAELSAGPSLSTGCQVWRFDGSAWTQVVGQDPIGTPGTGPGFGDEGNVANTFLAVYNDFLYAGTFYQPPLIAGDSGAGAAASTGCQVWRFDRTTWTQSNENGFGSSANVAATCMKPFFGTAFVGTENWQGDLKEADGAPLGNGGPSSNGCEIWALPYTYYFAEGTTRVNFQEYLCLGNPFDVTAHVTITYMFLGGGTQTQAVEIQPYYRATIDVNSVVGPDKDVSCKLESDLPIAAERPMYFNYGGVWSGGHDAAAADATSTNWYFAEGYTGPVFEEWICVLNPQDQPAKLTFNFQTQEDGLRVVGDLSVDAHSRGSFKVNDILGPNFQTSLKLESSVPVVAERPMYFDYYGRGYLHWPGGHCVMGTTSLAKSYSFAEGTTRYDFDEWITLQNPHQESITVNAVYQFGPDQGDPVTKSYTVGPGRRETVFVSDEVGKEKDVSVTLTSSSEFLAERPMYFHYTANGADWKGGDCVIGSPDTATEWFFGEGATLPNFQQWLCLQNPSDTAAKAEIYYFTQEKGALPARPVDIPAKSRVTIWVNGDTGPDLQFSTRVKVISGPAIIAERPMYFLFNGVWGGGHDVVGYTP